MKFKELDVKFHLGSDAHSLEDIGNFSRVCDLIAVVEDDSRNTAPALVPNGRLAESILRLIIRPLRILHQDSSQSYGKHIIVECLVPRLIAKL